MIASPKIYKTSFLSSFLSTKENKLKEDLNKNIIFSPSNGKPFKKTTNSDEIDELSCLFNSIETPTKTKHMIDKSGKDLFSYLMSQGQDYYRTLERTKT